jgi:hypothetical protein
MSKHTPGPWKPITKTYTDRRGEVLMIENGTDAVAELVSLYRPLETYKDSVAVEAAERKANANLIAAAPTMLAALDDLCGPGGQHEHACDKAEHDNDSGCIWCCAREAIAKAEGTGHGD